MNNQFRKPIEEQEEELLEQEELEIPKEPGKEGNTSAFLGNYLLKVWLPKNLQQICCPL